MKKNKLLLSLGSLSIFSAIPFVALLNVIIQKLKIIIIVVKKDLELLILEQLKKKMLKLT
nr:variable surface lipoprotein [Mycoplasmopsis bovis]